MGLFGKKKDKNGEKFIKVYLAYFESRVDYHEGYFRGLSKPALALIDAKSTKILKDMKKILSSGTVAASEEKKVAVIKSLLTDYLDESPLSFVTRDSTEKQVTLEILTLMSGQNFGDDISKWREWWGKQPKPQK